MKKLIAALVLVLCLQSAALAQGGRLSREAFFDLSPTPVAVPAPVTPPRVVVIPPTPTPTPTPVQVPAAPQPQYQIRFDRRGRPYQVIVPATASANCTTTS